MAIYDLGTASLAANGEVTGVGTTWKAPLTLIRVGATIVFKTEPVKIYTISEIISDTQINVYNPNSETVPAGTGYAILAHDGITVQGLAQDVAETLRYYQSRETEVADAVDAFNNFDFNDFESKVTQVNNQYGDVVNMSSQVAQNAAQVAGDMASAAASAGLAMSSEQAARGYAESLSGALISLSGALISSFESGGVIESRNQQMIWLDSGKPKSYVWMGDLPKTVPENSTPYSSGGIGDSSWSELGSKGYVSFYDFGCVGDGITNDISGINRAINYAKSKNLKIKQNDGVFLVSGSDYIDIGSLSADFTGSVIKPSSSWTGQITITNGQPTTYDASSSVVSSFNSMSNESRAAGSNLFDSISENRDLDGCFIVFYTNQDMYTYRDSVQKRIELNRVYNRGYLENSLKYDLGNNVTSVRALKINKTTQEIKGLTIDESLSTRYQIVYVNNSTRLLIKDISFINKPITQVFSDTRLAIANSYDITVDGLFAESVADARDSSGELYSYALSIGESMNVRIMNARVNGKGWGANGSNNCANVTFENCDLSRIDFHMPFHNYLKIENCNIGARGVVVTGLGDLHIRDSAFNASRYTNGNIITTRADAGGFFDGNLYMDNITFTGTRSTSLTGTGLINGISYEGNGPVAGSPIKSTLFNSVRIKGLNFKSGNYSSHPGNLFYSSRDGALLFPSDVSISDVNMSAFPSSASLGLTIDFSRFKGPFSDMTNSESSLTGRFTTNISIKGILSNNIVFMGANSLHNPNVSIYDLSSPVGSSRYPIFETNQRGSYYMVNCNVERLRAYYGSDPNGPVAIKFVGGIVKSTSGTTSPVDGSVDHDISFINTRFVCNFNGQSQSTLPITTGISRMALLSSCDFFDISGVRLNGLNIPVKESTSVTVGFGFRLNQDLVVTTGVSGTNTFTANKISVISDSPQRFATGTSSTGTISFALSGTLVSSTTISTTSGNQLRSVKLI